MPAQLVKVISATTVMAPHTIAGRRKGRGRNAASKTIPAAARMVSGHPGFHGYLSRLLTDLRLKHFGFYYQLRSDGGAARRYDGRFKLARGILQQLPELFCDLREI
jgi:hypothetical protein